MAIVALFRFWPLMAVALAQPAWPAPIPYVRPDPKPLRGSHHRQPKALPNSTASEEAEPAVPRHEGVSLRSNEDKRPSQLILG
eukprot:Skav206067  [mRNA]  locus=scaffold288:498374:503146:- [translate_table: standard]